MTLAFVVGVALFSWSEFAFADVCFILAAFGGISRVCHSDRSRHLKALDLLCILVLLVAAIYVMNAERGGKPWSHLQKAPPTPEEAIEKNVQTWSKSLGYRATKENGNGFGVYFAYSVHPKNGDAVLVGRSEEEDGAYLSFDITLLVSPEDQTLLTKFSQKQFDQVMDRLSLEMAKLHVAYGIFLNDTPPHVNIQKSVHITNSLDKFAFSDDLDEVDKAAEVCRDTLRLVIDEVSKEGTIADTLDNQLKILKVEQDARINQQNRHAILELSGHSFKEDPIVKMQAGVVLVSPETVPPPPGTAMLVQRSPDLNHVTLHFYLRNVGNAPAINVKPTAKTNEGVTVDYCVDLTHHAPFSYKGLNVPCENFVLPPIYPRPKNRVNPVTDSSINPDYDYDPQYDVAFDVVFQIPPKIGDFSLELVITAEQLVPLFYQVYCDVDFSRP